ncbi:glycoside hydrolase family 26 protein [Streptomyces hundungensis]|uniref:glycoside hydrolase family 26 protein n=1 Tax=Streptomyces hundungensis TaxID=1077946 RepID=UPI0033E21D47
MRRASGTGPRRRRASNAASSWKAALCALVLLLSALVQPPGDRPRGPMPTVARTAAGVFTGSDGDGIVKLAAAEKWRGQGRLRAGHTYLPGDTWSGIEGPSRLLAPWARWRHERTDRVFVLNVPMLARNEAGLPDAEVRDLLGQGARGAFDGHFTALAERLVALRLADTNVVLGWEMNGVTYTHRCAPDPASWRAYWRRVVTAMRSVAGQHFRFDFAPNRGRDAVPWTECYPGDAFVDIVGMDSYDQPAGMSFREQVEEPYGLRAQVDFAARHGKPVSYPEWGLFRNGDDARYVRGMTAWFRRYRPVYQTLTDYCPHGVWECPDHPEAAHAYRAR